MKLYATITSERATKGQGGKELMIEINGEKGNVIARIKATRPNPETDLCPTAYLVQVFPVAHKSVLTLELKGNGADLSEATTKGEKQKDECYKCHNTTKGLTEHKNGLCCDDCWS